MLFSGKALRRAFAPSPSVVSSFSRKDGVASWRVALLATCHCARNEARAGE